MAEPTFDLTTYYPIFIYLVILIGFAVSGLIFSHIVGPHHKSAVKDMPYESGMDPIGDARQHFDVKFYLVAIMFLVFDVEMLFLVPWAVIAYGEPGPSATAVLPMALKAPVFWSVLVFLLLLLVAYIYDWRKGVFRWR
jgi:NADH-quinone oxidoreductase subunit A